MKIVCMHCGKPESAHCTFEPLMPKGCQCDYLTWIDGKNDEVNDVCDKYLGNGITYCSNCNHDKICHKS